MIAIMIMMIKIIRMIRTTMIAIMIMMIKIIRMIFL